jgi:hypothetical protein
MVGVLWLNLVLGSLCSNGVVLNNGFLTTLSLVALAEQTTAKRRVDDNLCFGSRGYRAVSASFL